MANRLGVRQQDKLTTEIGEKNTHFVNRDFLADTPLLFRCSFTLEDTFLPGASDELNSNYTDPIPPDGVAIKRLLGQDLYKHLKLGLLLGPGHDARSASSDPLPMTWGRSFAYDGDQLFHYGIGRQNTTESELWLARYIANSIGIRLVYLNNNLPRFVIRPAETKIGTFASIEFYRLILILSGLLLFQILFAATAIWYCHGSMELLDEVPTYSNMFGNFPWPSDPQAQPEARIGEQYAGKFIPENGGYRWVFGKKED